VRAFFNRKKDYVINRLAWDSACFGYEVGMVTVANDLDWQQFVKESRAYQLVYIFSKNELRSLPQNIKKVDEKITLRTNIDSFGGTVKKGQNVLAGQIIGLDSLNNDILNTHGGSFQEEFLDLALISGEYSRFKTDERLNHQEFERLYCFWAHKALVEDDKGFAFVKEGQVLGMITLTTAHNGAFKISLLAVDPGSRNQGIGRALLDKALRTGIDRGSRALWVTTQKVNIPAMELYQKVGFEIMDSCNVYHWWKD
jgi:dTDP-4-amino-4,6-dideoxy-D-galactose acyltransferase